LLTLITLIFFSAANVIAQDVNIELANEYFKNGEYQKAADMYAVIAKKKGQSRLIHSNYYNALIKLKQYDEAEDFVKKQIKTYDNIITYQADYAYLLEISGKVIEAENAYKELIETAAKQDTYVYQLQNFFYQTDKINLLIDLFLLSREKSKDPEKHDIHLARAYLFAGKKQEMLNELLNYGVKNQNGNYVQKTIEDNISEEDEIIMLERTLIKRIQANPNELYYTNLLYWNFVQQKQFMRAFTQAKALDKRMNADGTKVFELAGLTFQNKDYRSASKMYQYIMDEYPSGDLYPFCRRWYIQSKEEIVKTTYPLEKDDIMDLISQYESMLNELGKTPKTIDAIRNMALLHGFYLENHQKAIEILESAIETAGSNTRFKDECKLDMGDIYILKDEPWEATLIYMQVEKSQKEERLGEEAKLKNARLYYFTGEFELAKDILDILKKATTREIANDAMKLSLLIQDNLGLDTTDAALKAYSSVELMLYQNKNEKALTELTSLFKKYKSHSLADEILWLKANTLIKLDRTEEALKDLQAILDNYKFDILADDALFSIAQITENKIQDKDKAMELYKLLLKEFPGSIYAADARKRFRDLRGDFVY
jgi:predicted Zn-dependent protease